MITRVREWVDSIRQAPLRDVVGVNRRNAELIYPHNDRRNYRFGDDKLLAKSALQAANVPVPHTIAVCDGLYAIEQTMHELSHHDGFVVKPSRASGGQGILVLAERCESNVWLTPKGNRVDHPELRRHFADIIFGAHGNQMSDVAYAEALVRPHPFFDSLWKHGLADVRVLTHEGTPFMAMLRIPTLASDGRANLHQGGVGVAVDLESGRITRALWRGKVVERHPESNVSFVGLQLPSWERIVQTAKCASAAVPLGYLGVDLVVDASGLPLVLEVNVRPGLEIQNVHGESIEHALRRAKG